MANYSSLLSSFLRPSSEPAPLPKATQGDYDEFVKYLRQKDRRFLRPGRSVQEEFTLFRADMAKRRPKEEPAVEAGSRE